MREILPLQYKVENGAWIMIDGATVAEDDKATQAADGKISLDKKISDYTVNFPTTERTKFVRLTAHQADLGAITNYVLTEVIITGKIRI